MRPSAGPADERDVAYGVNGQLSGFAGSAPEPEPLDAGALPHRRHGPKPMPAPPAPQLDLAAAIRERLDDDEAAALLERISREQGFPVSISSAARPKRVLERFVREWLSEEETQTLVDELNRRPS